MSETSSFLYSTGTRKSRTSLLTARLHEFRHRRGKLHVACETPLHPVPPRLAQHVNFARCLRGRSSGSQGIPYVLAVVVDHLRRGRSRDVAILDPRQEYFPEIIANVAGRETGSAGCPIQRHHVVGRVKNGRNRKARAPE